VAFRVVSDWQMQPTIPNYAMAHSCSEGGINGGVGAAAVRGGGPGHLTFYVEVPDVEVPDLEAGLNKIESLGGSRAMGPMDMSQGLSITLFTDPEGHVVGLFKARTRHSQFLKRCPDSNSAHRASWRP
jgi:predicted enzyme related to lactoylglutathione lyase